MRKLAPLLLTVMVAVSCGSAGGERDSAPVAASPDTAPEDSVVRLGGESCGLRVIGGGVVVGEGLVLTNAHVIAGASEILVAEPGDVEGAEAELVAFDANRDLALVRRADLTLPAATVGRGEAGDRGELLVVDGDGLIDRRPFEIRRSIRATGDDIYREPGADRRAFEVSLAVDPGESGSGLFDADGYLVGIAFASSRRQDVTTYAVADTEIEAFLAGAGSDPIDTGQCPP